MGEIKESDHFLRELEVIAEELTSKSGIEVRGKREISVTEMDTLAIIKGNRIYINIKARKYSRYLLKYILCHEIAHLAVKRHTKRFWEIVRNICPDYELAHNELIKRHSN
jgi:predicted metal-dependent hydrolase